VKARAWVASGDLPLAAIWAEAWERSSTGPREYLVEFEHLTYVRVLLAQHRDRPSVAKLGEAAMLLCELVKTASTSGRWRSVVEIHMLTALVRDAQGHRTTALDALGMAFSDAPEPDAYMRLFLDEGDAMTTLLEAAEQAGVCGPHPGRLLAEPARTTAAATLLDPLSERELQVLRLLDSDLSGPDIARQLFVSHNTVRTHTRHIFAKLQVSSRRAAVRQAREQGVL
jgi:LuxR family maltose regulon positive regulatory protein